MLVLFKGSSIRESGEEMQPGIERSVVLAVGHPAGWIADRLAEIAVGAFGWISPDDELDDAGGFEGSRGAAPRSAVPVVTPESFDPAAPGESRGTHERCTSCS